jgi:enamine deaminase RidA (YjgF/YER057c/UK114 family)
MENSVVVSDKAPAPASAYAAAVATPSGMRWLSVSGQVGVSVDGVQPEAIEDEIAQSWRNVIALLNADGMDVGDIVDVLAIVTDHSGVAPYRSVRDKVLGGHVCGSTMLVCGLANPDWRVEIAVRAAKSYQLAR